MKEFSSCEVGVVRIYRNVFGNGPKKFRPRLRTHKAGSAESESKRKPRHVVQSVIDALTPEEVSVRREARSSWQLYCYARPEAFNVQRPVRLNRTKEPAVREWREECP